jgi:hypothetical protein
MTLPIRRTVAELCALFPSDLQARDYAANSIKQYQVGFDHLRVKFGAVPVDDKRFAAAGRSPSSARRFTTFN